MGTVTHAKVSGIADDPAAAAAGEVVPSDWNANHNLALTSADVGLGNVDNTSDANKPVSTAQATAIATAQATAISSAATAAAVLYRPKLAADQTKNVPADFATLTLALAYAATIDFNGFTLTIKLANGTYTAPGAGFIIPYTVGQSTPANLLITGDTTTPSNVVMSFNTSFIGMIVATAGARCRVSGIQFLGTGSNAFGLSANSAGYIQYTACDFNANLFAGVVSQAGGTTECVGTATFSATMPVAVYATNGGYAFQIGSTITTANTPAWTAGYVWSDAVSFVRIAAGTTFGGTGATGTRYSANRNAVIDVGGAGANYFPGNVAGSVGTGGIYS